MPTSSGFSPSEMLNGWQMRTRIDTLLPSPAYVAQGKQTKEVARSSRDVTVTIVARLYTRYTSEVDSEPGEWLRESPIVTDHPLKLEAELDATADLGASSKPQ